MDEFKKTKPPTFDGELKKPNDVEAWLLGMKKFFDMHDYIENMKASIAIFSLKGKLYIWWEYVKRVGGINTEKLIWNEFKRLFKKNYLSERYYGGKAKALYELKMETVKN